jgi:ubiquinone/menaquinone biosynthesis C-methylase UbiE
LIELERIIPGKVSNSVYQEHLSRYLFASVFTKDKLILDAACGTGYGSKILAYKGRVVGIDISKISIRYASKYCTDCDFLVMDVTHLGFRNDVFDVICSFETIEHIKDYKKYLVEMRRVLKSGGLLIISTPLKEVFSPLITKPTNPYHVHEFSVEDIRGILSEYFSITAIYGQGFSVINRFLFPYIYIVTKFSKYGKYLEKLAERLKAKTKWDYKITYFRKNRLILPKYVILICGKCQK